MSIVRQPRDKDFDAGTCSRTIGKYLPIFLRGRQLYHYHLAVVSGVVGASLSSTVILILGFANLLADGFSMGASNVLSRRSDVQNSLMLTLPIACNIIGFVTAGIVLLPAYGLPMFEGIQFAAATFLGLSTLFAVGAGRALFTGRGWLASGFEMLLLGSFAAAIAYGVEMLGATIIRQAGT